MQPFVGAADPLENIPATVARMDENMMSTPESKEAKREFLSVLNPSHIRDAPLSLFRPSGDHQVPGKDDENITKWLLVTVHGLLPFLVCLFALYAARAFIIMCLNMCLNTHKYTFMAEILVFFFYRLQVLLEGNRIKTPVCMQDVGSPLLPPV